MIPEARALARPWPVTFGDLLEIRLARGVQLVLAYAVVLLPALSASFIQPVWQLTDEAQHYDVLVQYAHGVYPVEGVTTLRPETVGLMVATGNYRWSPPETQPRPAVVDPAQFEAPPPYLSGYAFQLWVRRHIWWFSYEAMQPPLFYAVATPVWAVANWLTGPYEAVYAVRVLNALALALLGPMALVAAGMLLPARRAVAVTSVLGVAALPGLLLNATQVTNDTFGAVLGCATIVVAARAAWRGWTWRQAVLVGGLFGLTLLAKLTAAGLVLAVAAAWAWPMLRLGAPFVRQLRFGIAAALAAALPLLPWLVVNQFVYGHLVPSAAAARLLGAGTSSGHYTFAQSVLYCWITFWTGEHEWTLPYSIAVAVLMLPVAGGCIVGLARLLRGNTALRAVPPVAAVLGIAVLAQIAWALMLPATSGLGGMTPGRYLYPVVVPALVLLVAGGVALVRSSLLQAATVAVLIAVSAINFGAYAEGKTATQHEERSGPPTRVPIQDVHAEGTYNGVTVTVDRMVLDPRVGSVWVHIHASNVHALSADWWPGPAVRAAGHRVRADYAASTPFPETLGPQTDYWGWIRLGLPPRYLHPGGTMTLTFEDVATNHYRDVGNLVVDVPVPSTVSGTFGVGGDATAEAG
ncbi:MAG TPA: hypothetical protein VF134_03760 [Candidatus Dormibacteraeota bacterium]